MLYYTIIYYFVSQRLLQLSFLKYGWFPREKRKILKCRRDRKKIKCIDENRQESIESFLQKHDKL